MDQLAAVIDAVRSGVFETPGKLSSALGDPAQWRPVVDRAAAEGFIGMRYTKAGARLEVTGQAPRPVWGEEAEARLEAGRYADSHTPLALEEPAAHKKSFPEKSEMRSENETRNPPSEVNNPSGIRELTEGEMFALDLNPTALAEERREAPAVEKPVKRRRRTPEEIEAAKVAKDAERAQRAAQRLLERSSAKAERAAQRVRAKQEALQAKITAAEGGFVELPAVVLRDGTVRHVSDQDAWAVLAMYLGDLMIDVEHTGYPPGHKLYELRTVQLGGEHAAIVFDASDSGQMQIAALALQMAGKLRAHSATADAIPSVIAGLIEWDAIWAKMQDSVLNAKLSDPKMSGSDADALKELAADLLREYAVSPAAEIAKNELFKAMGCLTKTELTTPAEKNGWYRVNKNSVVMTRYAGSDVLDLAAVIRVLPPIPVDESVMAREREFQAACATVTYTGFKLDADHIKAKIAEYEDKKTESQRNVQILSDDKIANPKSPDVIKLLPEVIPGLQLGVNRKTKRPSADKGSLEKVALDYKDDPMAFHLVKQILEYRHCDTTLGLLLRPLEQLCEHGDGRMRPTIYTIEASTGRCSSRRPNGMQFSRQGGIRKCVVADDGFVLIGADFEGCEIRVAAGLSGDRGLLEAEVSPRCYLHDSEGCCGKPHTGLHWMTAHTAFGKNATKEHRYWCKRAVFSKLFGGGVEVAAAQAYCSVTDAQKVFDAFREIAPEYTQWDSWLRNCYREGTIVWRDYSTGQNFSQPIEGTRRMIYRSYSGRQIYISNGEHAAGNGAIQGTARELLVDGTLRWYKTPWGHYPILPIHDQIVSTVPVAEASRATEVLAESMATSVLSSPGFLLEIGAEVDTPSAFWADSS